MGTVVPACHRATGFDRGGDARELAVVFSVPQAGILRGTVLADHERPVAGEGQQGLVANSS